MSNRFSRGQQPPPARGDRTLVCVYPQPGNPLECVFLGDDFLGMNTHWIRSENTDKGRSVLCMRPDPCVCDEVALPVQWCGYIAAYDLRRYRNVCAVLSRSSSAALHAAAPDRLSLRGFAVLMERVNESPRSPVEVKPSGRTVAFTLPPAPDIIPTLNALYGTRRVAQWLTRFTPREGQQ